MSIKRLIGSILFSLSILTSVGIIAFCVNQIITEQRECKEIEDSVAELKDTVIRDREKEEKEEDKNIQIETEETDENMKREIDWDELANINEDIIAWIWIPNTNIDYPILQEKEIGGEYYLHHDYKGDYLYAGSVFTPKEPNDSVEDAHMLLFAHRMKDKTIMFSSLHTFYADEDTMLEHQYAYIYWKDKTERWDIWCTKNAKADDAVYVLPYSIGSKDYDDLISNIGNTANYTIGESPTTNDRTLVLSTCSGSVGGSDRFYVVFKLDKTKTFQKEV